MLSERAWYLTSNGRILFFKGRYFARTLLAMPAFFFCGTGLSPALLLAVGAGKPPTRRRRYDNYGVPADEMPVTLPVRAKERRD